MKILCPLFALFVMTIADHALAQMAPGYQIAATVKTVTRNKSDRQQLPRGSTRLVEEEKVLSMQLRRTNPNAPESAEVRWVILGEDISGRTRRILSGKQQVATQVGIPVELESESFSLMSREWSGVGGFNSGSVEQKVKGFGVIVVDAEGRELGSRFSAAGIEAEIRKEFAAIARQEKEAEEAPRTPPPGRMFPPRQRW